MEQAQEAYNSMVRKLNEKRIKGESANQDARFILPNAAETKIMVTMNARELQHFFRQRCCNRAQWEIRAMAEKMLKLVKKQHSRRIFRQRLIRILGFVCCVFLSPLLIKTSILLSGGINGVIAAAGNILDTPAGTLSAVLCALLLFFFMRRQIFRLVQAV